MANLTNINVYNQDNWANISSTNDSDLNFVEAHVVVETYKSGTSWYRVYSDGWCEQGGLATTSSSNTAVTINLLVDMIDTSYNALICQFRNGTTGEYNANFYIVQKYTNSIKVFGQQSNTIWRVEGYTS